MTRYAIIWDAGFGENWAEADTATAEQAEQLAYEAALEEFESSVSYHVEVMTKEVAANYGFEWEEDE